MLNGTTQLPPNELHINLIISFQWQGVPLRQKDVFKIFIKEKLDYHPLINGGGNPVNLALTIHSKIYVYLGLIMIF